MKILCTSQMGTGTVLGQTMRIAAIAKALQRRGHEVLYMAAGQLISILRDFGIPVIEAVGMPPPVPFLQDSGAAASRRERSAATLDMMRQVGAIEAQVIEQEKPDLLLSGTLSGSRSAAAAGIPSTLVFLQPHGANTFTLLPDEEDQAARVKLFAMLGETDLILLEGMSELSGGVDLADFAADPASVREKIRFTGPLLLNQPEALPGRDELRRKYGGTEERPLVYVTIGGGSNLISTEFLQTIMEALALLTETTAIVAMGMAVSADMIASYQMPPHVQILGFAPGAELIKASDVTVFHGGSSTLMSCIACGVPVVVIPSMGEQEDNGRVMAQAGAGIVLDKKTLTARQLADAVQTVLGRQDYGDNARRLQAIGQRYGGAQAAAGWVEALVEKADLGLESGIEGTTLQP